MPHDALRLLDILNVIEEALELEPAGPNRKNIIAYINTVRAEAEAELEQWEEEAEAQLKNEVIH
tara:strand:+ start:5320 stop:5511 length:192 start_codon:yes stop_codon:yes gene_type:complete